MLNWIVWKWTICIKMDLALNNLQRLICHKTQINNQLLRFEFESKIIYRCSYWINSIYEMIYLASEITQKKKVIYQEYNQEIQNRNIYILDC